MGEEPYGNMNHTELEKMLKYEGRLGDCELAPTKVNELVKDCWKKDPSERPTFEKARDLLSTFIRQDDTQMDTSRSRLDNGMSGVAGYLDMSCNQILPSKDVHNVPRISYWTNYRMVHGPAQQVQDQS